MLTPMYLDVSNPMTTSPTPLGDLHLFGPGSLPDPYPLYHRLRALPPVSGSEKLEGWRAPGYDAVSALARTPRVSVKGKSELTQRRIKDFRLQLLRAPLSRNILSTAPPVHTRLRSL